ncbi:MAG TPA: R3H domain-containing nucleic acid-binding protein [Candidatus Portnoybacteria bacterium]|nr:R3H domain-containing nucleic acid-binding protein [Candidatus Portnoybacteria bacterium]
MEQEKLAKIKELIEGLISSSGLEGHVAELSESEGSVLVQIESQEAGYLIGRNGDSLRSLQQLARAMVSKKIVDAPRLTLDINNYQQERIEMLKSAAQSLAREVVRQGSARYLPPMNAYERRIIHMTLIDLPGIKTESEGDGEERRVVIKPAGNPGTIDLGQI